MAAAAATSTSVDMLRDFPADYDNWALPPEAPTVTVGDEMTVEVLSTWNGPSRFVVADAMTRADYMAMEEEMNAFYVRPQNTVKPPPSPLKIGGLYVGYFTNYRSW